MKMVTLKEAKIKTGLCGNTLRKYADDGRIKSIRTKGNRRLFDVDSFFGINESKKSVICYCRVSSIKQKDDLARQVYYMRQNFPDAEIIQDIGSGLNYRRKGLRTILERLLRGGKLTIMVAYKDRLARFGYELIEYMVKQNGGEIMVLNKSDSSPEQELTQDLLTILTVFSCRMHGLRRYYTEIKKDKNISNEKTKTNI